MRKNNSEPSRYQTAVAASNTKRFIATFFDILIIFILSLSLFSIGDLILTNTSIFKSNAKESQSYQDKLYELVESSRLTTRENNSLKNMNEICEDYVYSLTLLTLQDIKPLDEISQKVYQNITPLTLDNDRVYFYQVVFKKIEVENYLDDTSKDVDSYYDFFVTQAVKDYYVKTESFPVLNEKSALLLDEYFVNNSQDGKKVYEDIYNNYLNHLSASIDEFIISYTPYIKTNEEFEQCTERQLNLHGIVLLITFFLAVLILYIILPFIFKDGKTISTKILGLAFCDVRGYSVSWINVVLRALFTFISSSFILFLIMLLTFGIEGTYFMSINILGFFNIFTAFIISLIYLLISSVLSFIPRKTQKQSLTDILSLSFLKNTKEFYADEVRHFQNGKKQ